MINRDSSEVERLFCGREGKQFEAGHSARFFGIEKGGDLETFDFRRQRRRIVCRIELADSSDTALAEEQVPPTLLRGQSDSRDAAEASYDDPPAATVRPVGRAHFTVLMPASRPTSPAPVGRSSDIGKLGPPAIGLSPL